MCRSILTSWIVFHCLTATWNNMPNECSPLHSFKCRADFGQNTALLWVDGYLLIRIHYCLPAVDAHQLYRRATTWSQFYHINTIFIWPGFAGILPQCNWWVIKTLFTPISLTFLCGYIMWMMTSNLQGFLVHSILAALWLLSHLPVNMVYQVKGSNAGPMTQWCMTHKCNISWFKPTAGLCYFALVAYCSLPSLPAISPRLLQ